MTSTQEPNVSREVESTPSPYVVIVESPNKVKTIRRILGNDYKVVATFGNFYDLDKNGEGNLGIDVEHDFKPSYVVTKPNIVTNLKRAVDQAEKVFLATDPDREGEAISSHVCEVLGLDPLTTQRLEFNEITVIGINDALAHPRTLDLNLVASQETRRIVDRIMGFRLSNLVQRKLHASSAGRVQSAALKMIVDREREVLAFVPETFYTLSVNVQHGHQHWDAKLLKVNGEEARFKTKEEVEAIIAQLPKHLPVTSIHTETKSVRSLPAFTTSQLQQTAFSLLRLPIATTMKLAQSLYEGIVVEKGNLGLITYMRTDSVRVSNLFASQAKKFIEEQYGSEFVGFAKNYSSAGQDAHEGIRPTYPTRTPASLADYFESPAQQKLYDLIWSRGVASIMADKVIRNSTATLVVGPYEFAIATHELIEPGYTKVYGKYEKYEVYTGPLTLLEGDQLSVHAPHLHEGTTKGPSRFNEARIIKELDEKGIGRPSTYVQTLQKLISSAYVERQKGDLVPTELGMKTADALVSYFPSQINETYTARMEAKLDDIATGNTKKLDVLKTFYSKFQPTYTLAMETMEKAEQKVMGICPTCGSPLVERNGRYGPFIACSNYPVCKYIQKEEKVVVSTGETCPLCKQGELLIRDGRYGKFKACNRYPKCKYLENIKANGESTPAVTKPTKKATKRKTTSKKTTTTKKTTKKKVDSTLS